MRKIKIVVIGGGSGYTPELVRELRDRYQDMPVREIWLVDVEEGKEKLKINFSLCQRILKKKNSHISLYATINRHEALKDADFVLTQFRAGQMASRTIDENIPLKYNSIGQETNGAGEMLYAFRMIPVMIEIVHEMEKLCPKAWLINFANPAGMLSEAVLRYTKWTRIISICNGPLNIVNSIAKALDVSRDRLFVEFVGLNHLIFAKEIYLDGENITDKVIEIVNKKEHKVDNPRVSDWDPDFLRALGMIPISYLQYYWKTPEVLAEEKHAAKTTGSRSIVALKQEKKLFEIYKQPDLDVVPPELFQRGGAGYSACACELIYSIYSDRRDIQTINTANRGAITNLDEEDVAEINCVITSKGPIPLTIGKLPASVNGIIQEMKSFEKVACEAAVTGSYEKALLALTINPLVHSDKNAKKILDEMLLADEKYLPQFDLSYLKNEYKDINK